MKSSGAELKWKIFTKGSQNRLDARWDTNTKPHKVMVKFDGLSAFVSCSSLLCIR